MIAKRCFIALFIPLLAVCLMVGYFLYASRTIGAAHIKIENMFAQSQLLHETSEILDNALFDFFNTNNPQEAIASRERLQLDVYQKLTQLENIDSRNLEMAEGLRQSLNKVIDILDAILLSQTGPTIHINTPRKEFKDLIQNELMIKAQKHTAARETISQSEARLRLVFLFLAPSAVLLSLFIGLPVILSLFNRLHHLRKGIERIGAGALEHRIEVGGKDDLALLAHCVNEMADKLMHKQAQHLDQERILEHQITRRTADMEAANARLQKIDENRRQFLIDLGHALKTPLAATRVAVENALTTSTDNSKALGSLNTATHAIDDVIARVNELLSLARNEDGKPLRAGGEQVELFELLDERVAVFKALSDNNEFRLRYDGDEPLLVMGDRKELARMFDAILENALQHSPEKGIIQIECRLVDGWIKAFISDQGPGIARDKREAIFERFHSGSDGTGIGLSMSKRITEEHKGRISVEDTKKGGARIVVELPQPAKT